MKDARISINIQIPEIKKLETVALIPQWIASIHTLVENIKEELLNGEPSNKKEGKKKTKSLKSMRQEIIKIIDSIDPYNLPESGR